MLQMYYKILIPENFSFQECLWFLDRNYDDCLHEVRRDSVRKLLSIDETPTLIEISEEDNSLIINVLSKKSSENQIINFVKEWFDIDRDLTDFYQLLSQDNELAYMTVDYNGLRLLGIPDLFEALCWSIIGQQINLTFAYKLKRKLTETYGTKLTYENSDYYLFPSPAIVASLQVSDLMPMQFSTRKAEYLIEIAKQFVSENISKQKLEKMTTPEAIKALVNIRGIGEWTANYALMKSLKRLECVTYGDVGLYNALFALKGFPKRPSREQLDAFFEKFKNWEAYTVFYLWRSLAVKKYEP
jgi:DNA-3-methyladenine glycosylase II